MSLVSNVAKSKALLLWIATTIFVSAYVFLAFTPGSSLPDIPPLGKNSSAWWNLGHVVGSLIVVSTFYLAFCATKLVSMFHKSAVAIALCFSAVLAIVTESGQEFVPEHHLDLFDLWIDVLGGSLGIFFSAWITRSPKDLAKSRTATLLLAIAGIGLSIWLPN